MKQLDNGIWIPDNGQSSYGWTMVEKNIPSLLMNSVRDHNKTIENVIHAGGNIGLYTLEFAKQAKNVYVFEPEDENFSSLSMNCVGKNNIFLFKAALGNKHETVCLTNDDETHCGTWQVEQKKGNVPTLLIDDLNLSDVSIIHLDVEGYELFALQGAEKTIKQNYPLLAFEIMDHNQKYKYTKKELFDYVTSFGYNLYHEYCHEIMFMKK